MPSLRTLSIASLLLLAVPIGTLLLPGNGARLLFVMLVFAPVVEEFVFRAGLQDALLRQGLRPLVSSLLTALAFAAMHAVFRSPWLGLAVFPVSLLLSAVYLQSRRVGPCIALHAALNLSWLALNAADAFAAQV